MNGISNNARLTIYKLTVRYLKDDIKRSDNYKTAGLCMHLQMATSTILNKHVPYDELECYMPEFRAIKPKTVNDIDKHPRYGDYWFSRNSKSKVRLKKLNKMIELVELKIKEDNK